MKTIDWDSLTFVNNYVFQEVLKNKELCKYLIERILHIQIKDIRYLIAERHINSARISSKSIRVCGESGRNGTGHRNAGDR